MKIFIETEAGQESKDYMNVLSTHQVNREFWCHYNRK